MTKSVIDSITLQAVCFWLKDIRFEFVFFLNCINVKKPRLLRVLLCNSNASIFVSLFICRVLSHCILVYFGQIHNYMYRMFEFKFSPWTCAQNPRELPSPCTRPPWSVPVCCPHHWSGTCCLTHQLTPVNVWLSDRDSLAVNMVCTKKRIKKQRIFSKYFN